MKKIMLLLAIGLSLCFSDVYGQIDPYKWNRLPTNTEINKAKKELVNYLGGNISVNGQVVDNRSVKVSKVIKFHNRKQAGKLPPQDISRAIIFTEVKGVLGTTQREYNLFQSTQNNTFGFAKNGTSGFQQPTLEKQYNNFINYLNDPNNDSGLAPGFAPYLSDSKSPNDDENNSTMTVVIGALLAAFVAGLFIKKKRKGKRKKQDDKKENVKYILQLNKDHFNLIPGEPQQLKGQVWRATEKEKHVVSANFNLSCPEKNLKISPASASGTLKTQLLLKKDSTQPVFNVLLTATSGGHTKQRQIVIHTKEKRIEVKTQPNNSRNLRPDTHQQLTCYARVLGKNGKPLDELTKDIKFDVRQSKWLDLSDPIWDDGWAAINFEASDPDANAAVSHPPKTVTLGISVEYEEKNQLKKIENNLTINLLDCKIDTNTDLVSFPVTEQLTEVTLRAFIQDCDGEIPWKFDAFYQTEDGKSAPPLTEIEFHEISDTETDIILTGPIKKPDESERFLRTKLVIQAQQKEEDPLERDIYVMVSKEGLYVEDGADKAHKINFTADGNLSKDIDFSLYVYDEKANQIVVDEKGLSLLEFELIKTDKKAENLHSVLQPEFTFDELVYNIPFGRYNVSSTEEIPGYGDSFELHYRIKAPLALTAKKAELFETEIILNLKTKDDGRKHPTWDEAYADCKHIINTYIPEGTPRNKINALLEKRKKILDAEGLVGLRQQIWKIAYNLILAEGAEGYKNVDVWANRILVTLEWTKWAGDIAFNALNSYYMARFGAAGGLGATAISMAKDEVIEGINFYIYEDQPIEVFYDRQYQKIVPLLMNVTKGHLVSIENIEHFVTKNKALAWTIFIACEYTYNLYETRSMIEAAKATARQMRDELIIRKVTQHLHQNALRYKIPTTDVDNVSTDMKKYVKGTKKPNNDYEPSNEAPDLSGYTEGSIEAIKRIATKLKVQIVTRPTNAAAKALLKSGQAVAKKMFVKNKTINELDTYLGASKKDIGKVGSFKPKLNRSQLKKLPNPIRKKIVNRYKKRRREWVNQAEHLKENIANGKLLVKDGVVYDGVVHDGVSHKPFTGDIDIYDIRGAHGEKISKTKYKQVIDELTRSKVTNVEHGAHRFWEHWKGKAKDIEVNKGISDTINRGHLKEYYNNKGELVKGEALPVFKPGVGVDFTGVYRKTL